MVLNNESKQSKNDAAVFLLRSVQTSMFPYIWTKWFVGQGVSAAAQCCIYNGTWHILPKTVELLSHFAILITFQFMAQPYVGVTKMWGSCKWRKPGDILDMRRTQRVHDMQAASVCQSIQDRMSFICFPHDNHIQISAHWCLCSLQLHENSASVHHHSSSHQ